MFVDALQVLRKHVDDILDLPVRCLALEVVKHEPDPQEVTDGGFANTRKPIQPKRARRAIFRCPESPLLELLNVKDPVYCSFDAAATVARKLGLDFPVGRLRPFDQLSYFRLIFALSQLCRDWLKGNLQEQGLVEFVGGVVEVGIGDDRRSRA